MKSIFVEAREWFDKTGGNSYFAGRVEIDGELVAHMPFQYGYDDQYRYEALRELQKLNLVPAEARNLWDLKAYGFTVYSVKYESKKADAERFGKDWREVAA